jgi:hypothetical protein
MILVKQAGKGGFDPEWRSLRPFLSERLKSILTRTDKPARSRVTCQGGKIIKKLYLIVTAIRVRGMAGLSLGE